MSNFIATDDSLFCPICKDPLSNPYSLPCGHTFCLHPCLMGTKSAGGKLVCQMCNSSCEFCELPGEHKVSEKVASFKRAHETLRDATCKGCRSFHSECRLCNHCNDYLCQTCYRSHSEKYPSALLSRLLSLRMRYKRLLIYADKDEYRQDPELMQSINSCKAAIENALGRADTCIESLDALLSENVFSDSSINAPKQESGNFWSVRQVDEVISSGGQVVMEFPPSFQLPSGGQTVENSSMRPLPPKEASGPEKSWSHIHTAIFFVLSRNKSENPRPSNDAILRHFRQFGNVVQFHCSSSASGYIDYSSHQEALLSLSEPSQQIDGWLLKRCAIKKYPQCHIKLAKTFTVLFFQSAKNTSKGVSPSDKDLRRHLSRFGKIVHFQLQSNSSRGFVKYSSHSAAKKALLAPIHEVGNRNLYLHPIKRFSAFNIRSSCSTRSQSERKETSKIGKPRRSAHTAIMFTLSTCKSEASWSSNDALLGHFRKFGSITKFLRKTSRQGWIDYSCHQEALNALREPLQQLGDRIVRVYATRKFPTGQLPQEVTSNKGHTAIFFKLVRNKSKNLRPSNDAILGYFRQFGNVVQFHCYSCPDGYVDYSCHEEALSALNEPIQELEGWLVKPHPIKKYPQGLTELANTFTVLYFQLSMSTPKRKAPSNEDLKEYLSRFGRITHFQYILNPPCGYVEYSSHSEAKEALSEPTHKVGTWILRLHPIKEFPAACLQLGNREIPRSRRKLGNTSTSSPQRVKRRRKC